MSWVTWEPKSTIRTLSCMDGRCAPKWPTRARKGRSGRLFAGFGLGGQVSTLGGNQCTRPTCLENAPDPICSQLPSRKTMAFETERMRLPAALRGRTDRRAKLFRESLGGAVERNTLGLAWALSPTRIRGLPNVIRLCFDEFLAPDYALPDPERAFDSPSGLAGIVHDLSVPTLLPAYRRGLYPFAHIAPLKWWSPPARSVLFFDE